LLGPSPYHGVLAVKGFTRVARLRLSPAAPPDCLRCAVPGRFRAISPEQPEYAAMSQFTFESSLLVRDAEGHYLPATADQILAAARRIVDLKVQRGAPFNAPDIVKEYLGAKLAGLEHEVVAVLFLDNQHRLIEYIEMFRGTIDSASVYPREVVKEALKRNAAAVILSHNHPSGHAEPSQADRTLTERLKDALGLVDVRTLDHIIVAGLERVSFAELGLL